MERAAVVLLTCNSATSVSFWIFRSDPRTLLLLPWSKRELFLFPISRTPHFSHHSQLVERSKLDKSVLSNFELDSTLYVGLLIRTMPGDGNNNGNNFSLRGEGAAESSLEYQTLKLSVRSSRMTQPGLYKALDQSSWLTNKPPGAARKQFDDHDFPGYGTYNVHHTPRWSELDRIHRSLFQQDRTHEHMLGELEATAISGNDILSSTFYVSGLVTLSAGTMAPLCLFLVGALLYLFRGIYHEIG